MRRNKVLNICAAGVILLGCVSAFAAEESSKSFIPETTYVKGLMLNGLSVQASSLERRPVVIQVTEKGNISANFGIDMKHCRILGHAHGELASERIIIEAESMSCEDSGTGQIRSIKIEGEVVGPDGVSGIAARVVRNDHKELEKATLKQAENLIPVLHTSGSTYVDVIFTKGVSFESSEVAVQDTK